MFRNKLLVSFGTPKPKYNSENKWPKEERKASSLVKIVWLILVAKEQWLIQIKPDSSFTLDGFDYCFIRIVF
jgi:hypothetical protein